MNNNAARQNVKTIATPNHSLNLVITTRNAALGMALTYLDQVDQVLKPVYFLVQNLLSILISALHVAIPLACAWFFTHWNEQIEIAVWTGPLWDQFLSFFSAWLLSMFLWSLVWISTKNIIAITFAGLTNYAQIGGTYASTDTQRMSTYNRK